MFANIRAKALEERCTMLEGRCTSLLKISHTLEDSNHTLETENKQLRQKKLMEEEMIAHKLKMREESVSLDAEKRISEAERKAAKEKDEGIAQTKDEYRDKLETQLTKRGDEMKEIQIEILNRLPDVSLAIKQKS